MDVHEETGGRLRSLLEEAGTPALDDALLEGALARGGRLRRRRNLARGAAGTVGAAAVVSGLVVGVPALGGGAGRTVSAASRSSAPSGVSSGTDVAPPERTEILLREAADLFPGEAELGLRYWARIPDVDPRQPAVLGAQGCDLPTGTSTAGAVEPLMVATNAAVRGAARIDSGATQVSITVAAWADARGWTQLVADTGPCRWDADRPTARPGGERPDRRLLRDPHDPRRAVVIARVGTTTVGVVLTNGDAATVVASAERIADLTAARVEELGWRSVGVAP